MFRAAEEWEKTINGVYSPADTLQRVARKFESFSIEEKAMHLLALEMSINGGGVEFIEEKLDTISTTHHFKKPVYIYHQPSTPASADIYNMDWEIMDWLKENHLIRNSSAYTDQNNITADGKAAIFYLKQEIQKFLNPETVPVPSA